MSSDRHLGPSSKRVLQFMHGRFAPHVSHSQNPPSIPKADKARFDLRFRSTTCDSPEKLAALPSR